MNRIPLGLFLVFSCLIASGCKNAGDTPGESKGSRQRGLNVRVSQVEIRDVAYRVKTLGSLEPEELVQVTAQVNGAVSEVRFDSGDHVTLDTVLLRIDPERYRLEADRAEAEYRRAVADWRRAEAEMKRRETLAQDGLISDEELYRARQETERLAAIAAFSKAAQDLAQQNLRRSEVRSPRAGAINTRSVDTGQFVQIGAVLATLVDTTRLRLQFKVSDAESLRVKEGQTVTFRVSSLGDRDFHARIYNVGEVADSATRQVEVMGLGKESWRVEARFFCRGFTGD